MVQMRQNFVAQYIQLLKCWCDVQLGIVMEKDWVHSVDQCQLQALQFSVYLISLLSILLRCNGFTGIQKAVVDQMGADRQTVTMTFFGAALALGSALELPLGPATQLVTASCCIKSTFQCISQSIQEMICCCCME